MVQGGSNHYPALETSGPRWDNFAACLSRLARAVTPTCNQWLSSKAGQARVDDIFAHPEKYFAIAPHFLNTDGSIDHETDASADDVPGYGVIINYADFEANTDAYNWDTILHEMAHILRCEGFHQNDAEDDAAQDANAALLLKHCHQTLRHSTNPA